MSVQDPQRRKAILALVSEAMDCGSLDSVSNPPGTRDGVAAVKFGAEYWTDRILATLPEPSALQGRGEPDGWMVTLSKTMQRWPVWSEDDARGFAEHAEGAYDVQPFWFSATPSVLPVPVEQGEPVACRICGGEVRDNPTSLRLRAHLPCVDLLLASPTPAAPLPSLDREALVWDGIKVGFGIDDDERIEELERPGLLPAGWRWSETDGAGARWVVVFDVDHLPTLAEGDAVRRVLVDLGALAPDAASPTPSAPTTEDR